MMVWNCSYSSEKLSDKWEFVQVIETKDQQPTWLVKGVGEVRKSRSFAVSDHHGQATVLTVTTSH